MSSTYKCAQCGGEFEKTVSDEEAKTEYEANFPGISAEEPHEIVSDDCYNEIMKSVKESPEGQGALLGKCPLCAGDGWIAIPRWADQQKEKVRIFKVRCSCGTPLDPDEPDVLTLEQFDSIASQDHQPYFVPQ